MSAPDVLGGGAPRAASGPVPAPVSGLDRIVALALAAMALVLAMVFLDLRRSPTLPPEEVFDFQNPLLSAQPGQCVEVATDGVPNSAARLVVRPEGVVLRPQDLARGIPDWLNPRWPDPRVFPAYLLCEQRPAPTVPTATGAPPPRGEVLAFPLNGFGMPLENTVVLRGISQTTVSWNGQTRRAYLVYLMGYTDSDGPWGIYVSKDAPVLGVMRREFTGRGGTEPMRHSFRVPENCR